MDNSGRSERRGRAVAASAFIAALLGALGGGVIGAVVVLLLRGCPAHDDHQQSSPMALAAARVAPASQGIERSAPETFASATPPQQQEPAAAEPAIVAEVRPPSGDNMASRVERALLEQALTEYLQRSPYGRTAPAREGPWSQVRALDAADPAPQCAGQAAEK